MDEVVQPQNALAVSRLEVERGHARRSIDEVVVEEPLELRLNGRAVSVTMRTPGDDEALAVGFLWGEGILLSPRELIRVETVEPNVVNAQVAALVLERGGWQRNFYTTSSCGVCGKASLSMIRAAGGVVPGSAPLAEGVYLGLADRVRARQPIFARTGGLHAAADVGPEGTIATVCEDVGRHNAVDKIVGHALLAGELPRAGRLLFVSGRAGFELVQKAVAAGFSALVAVGAPTSLSIALAETRGLGLGGFLRGDRLNIYAHPERFATPAT